MKDDSEIARLLNLLRNLPDDERRFGMLKRIGADGGKLLPKWAAGDAVGYLYWPGLDRATRELFDADLSYLAERDYLRREMFDRVTRCPACAGANLNVREVCVACASPNIAAQPMLHHYRCGYVGALAAFETEGEARICPKCNGRLRHLGTDHEVVGDQFACRRCFATFEDAKVEGLCMACGAKTESDKLVFDDVWQYETTHLGHAAIRTGRLFDRDGEVLMEPDLPIFRRTVILSLIKEDVRRQARYQIPFSALLLKVRDAGTLARLRETLRDVDQVGRYGEDTVLVSLPATPEAGARLALDRMIQRLDGAVSGVVVAPADLDHLDAALESAARAV